MVETNQDFNVDDVIEGTVVSITEKQVFVDIGFKTEGIVPKIGRAHV